MNKVLTRNDGFSIVELLTVLIIIALLMTVSFYLLRYYSGRYSAEVDAYSISDAVGRAQQEAVLKKRTIRVEIDKDAGKVYVVDENLTTAPGDDQLLRTVNLSKSDRIRIESRPAAISEGPNPAEYPDCRFIVSRHPLSLDKNVCVMRFLKNGWVTDGGNDGLGASSVIRNTTIYVWQETAANSGISTMTYALTVNGATGVVRVWKRGSSAWTGD